MTIELCITWVVGLLLAAILTLVVIAVIYTNKYMVAHHCQPTGVQRTYYYTGYIFNEKGNIIGFYPINTIQYEYSCDNNEILWN